MKSESVIVIEFVNKSFKTNNGAIIEAVKDVSFEVKENDFICIIGPSGCGKSTLLRMIAGLETVTSGRITYRGEEIKKPKKEIGMVFQEYSLMPWRNVIDNVVLGPELAGMNKNEREKKAMEYLRLVGMEPFSRSFPHELSGGMRQRVAIIRALANNPDVLLMDEPFGALDAHTRILMQKELLKIWEYHKKTIIFVTHSVDEAIYLADKIMVMSARPGKIIETLNIRLDRPRHRNDPLYGELAEYILSILEREVSFSNMNGIKDKTGSIEVNYT